MKGNNDNNSTHVDGDIELGTGENVSRRNSSPTLQLGRVSRDLDSSSAPLSMCSEHSTSPSSKEDNGYTIHSASIDGEVGDDIEDLHVDLACGMEVLVV